MMKKITLFILMALCGTFVWAQMPGGKAVQVSHKTQVMNGRRYYVHVVEQGQTVYAISRAYGLKEIEAVTKKDIHFLQVGDTVWLPCKGQLLSDGTKALSATAQADETPSGNNNQGGSKTSGKQDKANTVVNEEPLGPSAVIRPRVNSQSIVVSLMMPFNLSQMDKISTSKFDVEQRGKITYKSLEFIQFYEGLLLGLEQLEKMGINVTLNVVDVEGTTDADVERAFSSHNVAQSDLLIALLTRQPFDKVAQLARNSNLFVVNPVADREEIVKGNPYVFKCMPSREACAKSIVRAIHKALPAAPVFIIHSGAAAEKSSLTALTTELDKHSEMHYSLVNWASASKLSTTLKNSPQAAVVSVYSQDKSKSRIYVSQLLNKLSAFKSNTPYLFTFNDWTTEYSDVDFAQLQNLNYHTFFGDWDMDDAEQKAFVELFRERYKTEPTTVYAGMANDIILYFVSGLNSKGTDFFKSPSITNPKGMLCPLSFSHSRSDYGFENQSAVMFRMTDFHFIPIQ